MLAEEQFQALESMLSDNDCETLKLVVPELKRNRCQYEDIVRRLAESSDCCVRGTALEILAEWEGKPLEEEGEAVCRCIPSLQTWEQLEGLCWHLSKNDCPCLCIDKAKRRLDLLAERVEEKLGGRRNHECVLRAMSCVISREEGFVGNIDDYYNPANSYLGKVLETRKGVPLTLTLVYVFVGLRLGYEMYGLNTPGHYLGRLGDHVFDAFNHGMIVTPKQLAMRFKNEEECWKKTEYYRTTPIVTAQRMLMNLANSYHRLGDESRLAHIVHYLKEMDRINPC